MTKSVNSYCRGCKNYRINFDVLECSNVSDKSYKIPEGFKSINFDNFNVTDINRKAYEKSKSFINLGRSLYMYGDAGLGKTHLMISALREINKYYCGKLIYYSNIVKLLKIERQEYETKEESEERMINELCKKRFIFIDDFCAENSNKKTTEILYYMLNEAIERGSIRFFITSNKDLKYISENLSDRIASRIIGLCGSDNIVKLTGDDYRLKV